MHHYLCSKFGLYRNLFPGNIFLDPLLVLLFFLYCQSYDQNNMFIQMSCEYGSGKGLFNSRTKILKTACPPKAVPSSLKIDKLSHSVLSLTLFFELSDSEAAMGQMPVR